MKQPEPLLTSADVAARLSVSEHLARDLMRDMRPVNVGSGKKLALRVHAGELERWMQAHTQQPECNLLAQKFRRKPNRVNYAELGLTPDGRIPYRHDERRKA